MNARIRLSFYNLIESVGQGDDCQGLLISQKETANMYLLVEVHTLAFWWQVFPPINRRFIEIQVTEQHAKQ